ncbi:TonB-dependent receptor [Prevotella sp.]|uniref:TonB-dependent receptor n=1 Tax=Prevotella sp. TaxID=59823 RepID=UPI002F93F9EF
MKRYLLQLLVLGCSVAAYAQSTISGRVLDRDTKEGLMQATVQLLHAKDSTFAAGTVSDLEGKFSVKAPSGGSFIVRITSVGYRQYAKKIAVDAVKDVALGDIVMGSDAIMLKGTTISGQARKVTLKEDTFVYNASAYRTPEGSAVEELVKRIPGAQVSDDGTITINGKTVKKIKVDGKDFMAGDTKTALKNLPTSIINNIKAYDEKSDLARITGIDDGDESTVLDFGMKPGMNKGMFSNIDLGAGTEGRYAARGMGAYFNNGNQLMAFANANNTNDMGFGRGGGRWGGGQNGLNAAKMLGFNYNYEKKDKLKFDASARWNHSDGDRNAVSAVQSFVNRAGAFSNSISQNYSRSNNFDGRLRLEWTPDSMTNILFRPSFTYSNNDGRAFSNSAAFNVDPYLTVTDPLSEDALNRLDAQGEVVNRRDNATLSYGNNKNFRAVAQLNRKFGSKGRNVTLRGELNSGSSDSKNLSLSNVHLYQVLNALGTDSTYQTNRWNLAPAKNWGYSMQLTYSEPVFRAAFLQFSYKYQYKYSKSDRSTYDFSNLGEGFFSGVPLVYGGWNAYLNKLANPLSSYLDEGLSRYSEYRNYIHELEVMLRVIREKYNFNVGVMVQPQSSKFLQDYQGLHVDTTRQVTNFSPTLDFRYRFSKVSNLRINYRGTTSQPGMADLLDITDDSDPLNIVKGNPGLKPSFTNSFRLFYNTYMEKRQRAIMTFANYNSTRNSISNMVTYDEATGGRTTRPENINGNWDANVGFMFNTAIDSAGYFNVNTFTHFRYNNYVGYLSQNAHSSSVKNTTRSTTFMERLSGSYRNSWLEFELDGTLNYTHSRNKLLSQSNLDTWQFSYGATVGLTAPWGTSISTDLHENSRRGYSDKAMNTNELIWNAQISQGFMRGNPLTVMLQFYDLLRNQSNVSRAINAIQSSDTRYNSVNSYVMLHVVYRLNIFGGKQARENMRHGGPREGRFGPPHGGPGRFGRGGFGGRRF